MVAQAKRYCSNTELYQDPELAEGVDYGRRHRRHELFDDSLDQQPALARTTIIAPHGGGIETGTSELCLAVAGYQPATLEVTPPAGPTYDYWMFEGLRPADNDELHVTSTRCDDAAAVSFCAGSLNALALHGCRPVTVGLPETSETVLVGGRNFTFKQYLLEAFADRQLDARDAAPFKAINGDDPANIVNRTLLGMGAHLELTSPLRSAMFEVDTRADRKNTTTEVFRTFTAACRAAIARLEAEQVIL